MKKAVLLAASLAGAILSPAFAASLPTVTIDALKSKSVYAHFSSVDETGCIQADVDITGADQVERILPNGTKTLSPNADVSLVVFDNCQLIPVIFANGSTFVQKLVISEDLKSASLKTTIPVQDIGTLENHLLYVNLVWKFSGPIQSSKDFSATKPDGTIVIQRFRGAIREAVATGSVVLDGETEYAPDPSTQGSIQKLINVTTTITKP
jgi:hypothetical protein